MNLRAIEKSSELLEKVNPEVVHDDVRFYLAWQAQHVDLRVVPEVLVPVLELVEVKVGFHLIYERRRYGRGAFWYKSLKQQEP